jgi:PIN domain nuclease of toxin-antitoxin system
MRLLLDTHVFLWWLADAPDLTHNARKAIASPVNECFLSLASCWELAIKISIGKLKLSQSLDRFVTEQMHVNSFRLLNIEFSHVAKVEQLPFHHRDPFDRLLVAQAISEKMPIVSADSVLTNYGIKRIW